MNNFLKYLLLEDASLEKEFKKVLKNVAFPENWTYTTFIVIAKSNSYTYSLSSDIYQRILDNNKENLFLVKNEKHKTLNNHKLLTIAHLSLLTSDEVKEKLKKIFFEGYTRYSKNESFNIEFKEESTNQFDIESSPEFKALSSKYKAIKNKDGAYSFEYSTGNFLRVYINGYVRLEGKDFVDSHSKTSRPRMLYKPSDENPLENGFKNAADYMKKLNEKVMKEMRLKIQVILTVHKGTSPEFRSALMKLHSEYIDLGYDFELALKGNKVIISDPEDLAKDLEIKI